MPRKERVHRRNKTELKLAAEDQVQKKLMLAKKPRIDSDSRKEPSSREETEDIVAHRKMASQNDHNNFGSNKNSPSNEIVKGTTVEEGCKQQNGIKRGLDLADIVLGKTSLTSLTDEEKYNHFK